MSEYLGLILASVSAFVGSLLGIARLGWWLRGQFSIVNLKIDAHEIKDVERFTELETKDIQRFNDLKMQILENRIQAQTIEALKNAPQR